MLIIHQSYFWRSSPRRNWALRGIPAGALPLGIAPATASQTLSENPSLAQAGVPGVDAVAWPMLVVPALGPAVALSWRCYGRTMLELSSQSPGPKPMSQYKV